MMRPFRKRLAQEKNTQKTLSPRKSIGNAFFLVMHALGALGLTAGSVAAVVLGKFFAALVLGLISAGVLFRFFSRKKIAATSDAQSPLTFLGVWVSTLAITAGVVEAVNLPVRMHQVGFEKKNWLILLAIAVAIYYGASAIAQRFFK